MEPTLRNPFCKRYWIYITHALQAAPPPLHFDDYRLSFNAPANWRLLMTVNGEAGTDFNHTYTYTPPPNNKNNRKKSTQQKRICLLLSFPSSPTHRKPGFPTGTWHSGEGWYGRASCHGGVWSMVPLAKTGNWCFPKNWMPNTNIKHQQKQNTDLKYRSLFNKRGWWLLMHGFGVLDLGKKNIFPKCPKTVTKPVKVTVMNLLCPIQGSWLIPWILAYQIGVLSLQNLLRKHRFLWMVKLTLEICRFRALRRKMWLQLGSISSPERSWNTAGVHSLYGCLRQNKSQHFQWEPGTKSESNGRKTPLRSTQEFAI